MCRRFAFPCRSPSLGYSCENPRTSTTNATAFCSEISQWNIGHLDGKEVRGKVDATGEWVKLKREHYLPVKVGQIQVLHPVETPEEPVPASPEGVNESLDLLV
eukprot:s3935_g2.t1